MGKRGRPTKRTEAVEKKIIDGLRAGTPLTVICRGEDMPHDNTVRDWINADPDFSVAIARAREAGFDQIALDALRIAGGSRARVSASKPASSCSRSGTRGGTERWSRLATRMGRTSRPI
jgi:hypothetical protein